MTNKNQQKGSNYERVNAKRYGGLRFNAGPGDDVVVPLGAGDDLHLECKSQQDYDGLMKLIHWTDQAKKYGEYWAVAMRLGTYSKKREFVVLAPELFQDMLNAYRDVRGI